MEENSEKSSRNKVQQSILSFVKSRQVRLRISEDEDKNSEGTQAQRHPEFRGSNDNFAAIPKVTEKGGPCSTTSNKSTCENNTLHAKSELPKSQQLLTFAIDPTPNQPDNVKFPKRVFGKRNRAFQSVWFQEFPCCIT